METADVAALVDQRRERLVALAEGIWNHPELSLSEERTARVLREELADAGFEITTGTGGLPTAFVARYGDGGPTIGILGEYDALPRMSQRVAAEKDPVEEGAPGHGCGHNLLGVGSLGGALALRDAIVAGDLDATVVYFGCPAEEELLGKVYMARDGTFDDLDAALTWHPGRYNSPFMASTLTNTSMTFSFSGESAHAAGTPQSGRSALDAVQLLNTGVEFLREHVTDDVRIHYSITDGGGAPNVVPDTAEAWYFVRAADRETTDHVVEWVNDIADGAATMTRTEVETRVLTAVQSTVPNRTIGDVIQATMEELGGIDYDDDQRAFAGELKATLDQSSIDKELADLPDDVRSEVESQALYTDPLPVYDAGTVRPGSTDVADVSRIAPLAQFWAATWPIGTPAHSWQATAANGSFGVEGMLYAAKVLAGTGARLAADSDLLAAARAEFEETVDGPYESALPSGATPPLDR